MMRIAVATWSSRRVGGIEDYLSMVIPALRAAGHDVAFWHDIDEPVARERIAVPPDALQICAAAVGAGRALAALREWHPDVIYGHGLVDPLTERTLLDLAPSVRFVHTYSGTCISGGKTLTRPDVRACTRTFGWPCLLHYFPRGCGGKSPVTMWREFDRQSEGLETLRQYRRVLTHSDHMREELIRHGVQADRVPFPVCSGASVAAARPRHVWHLVFAGRMDRLKGAHLLVEAAPIVAREAHRAVRVTLAGDGAERTGLEARARALAAPDIEFEFPGWIEQRHVQALMQDADLLVVPSIWPEPLGSVGPIAARQGVPAVAFDTGGVRTWLIEGVSGHLAPANPPTADGLASAIVRSLRDQEHYGRLCAGAREAGLEFTMERHLPALCRAFASVLSH